MPRKGASATAEKVPVRHVHVRNFLSLEDVNVNLRSLNVLVGPNGGGKSNFLSVFRFLGEVARTDLAPALARLFGGYDRLICRAASADVRNGVSISIRGEITEHSSPTALDEYVLSFRPVKMGNTTGVRRDENILLKRSAGKGRRINLSGGKFEFSTVSPAGTGRPSVSKQSGEIGSDASALSVLRRIGKRSDTKQVSQLAEVFEDLRLFDPNVDAAKRPSRIADGDRLSPNASNLSTVLFGLSKTDPDVFVSIQDDIRFVLPGFDKLEFRHVGIDVDSYQILIHEKGVRGGTPISFASYGTVRSIALFTMLRDPYPPRLTCLEEVDHGLHPHALDILVERLRDASKKSQIVVATHSPALVNRLAPEELVVFERDGAQGTTRIAEIEPGQAREMQDRSDLRLGELWYSGLLGGVPS